MPKWWVARVVAPLLHVANAAPPLSTKGRERFYAMKDRLLQRYGQHMSDEIQQITKTCWDCDGEGTGRLDPEQPCWKCGGSGVYDVRYSRLQTWSLGRYTFHRPIEQSWMKPPERVTIYGYIRHAPVGRAGGEACLWLALLYDRGLFWYLLSGRGGWPVSDVWPYPWTMVQRVLGPVLTSVRHVSRRRTCYRCQRAYRLWPWAAGLWSTCRRCRIPVPIEEPDDAPF